MLLLVVLLRVLRMSTNDTNTPHNSIAAGNSSQLAPDLLSETIMAASYECQEELPR